MVRIVPPLILTAQEADQIAAILCPLISTFLKESARARCTLAFPAPLPQGAPPVRHYLQFADFNADEYAYLLQRTAFIKSKFKRFENTNLW